MVADLAWLAGILGVSLKGASNLLGSALTDVEGWLWQAELDESVATAAAVLPSGLSHQRTSGDQVGKLQPRNVAVNDQFALVAAQPSIS